MDEAIKLVLPFLSVPKNYSQILKKLASFAFYEVYLITLMRRANPNIERFFSGIETWGPIGKVTDIIPGHQVLNLTGIAIAFAIALLTHMFQLHDRISDLLGIRRRFDLKSILIPLALLVGVDVSKDKEAKIWGKRDALMRSVFYKYASSRDDKPLVDKHDIEQALNAWSWFWVFVEAIIYFTIGMIIAFWLGSHDIAKIFAVIGVVCFAIACLQRFRLPRYAKPQVAAIAANAGASAEVKQQFDAL